MTYTKEIIELSKDSIKFSYLRFLSDSASGYIVVLVLMLSFYRNYPIFGIDLHSFIPFPSTEVKIFALTLFLFLSTPAGLMINGISWFFLGALTIRLENYFSNKNYFFLESTKISTSIDDLKDAFGIDENNWYSYSEKIETILNQFHPHIVSRYDHVEGVKILSRNLALIFIVSGVNIYFNGIFKLYNEKYLLIMLFISLIFSTLFIILTALIGVYQHSSLFSALNPICLKEDINYKIDLENELDLNKRRCKLINLIVKSSKINTI